MRDLTLEVSMKVTKHKKRVNHLGKYILHLVVVSSESRPNIHDVAASLFYPPEEYGLWEDSIYRGKNDTWKIKWKSYILPKYI